MCQPSPPAPVFQPVWVDGYWLLHRLVITGAASFPFECQQPPVAFLPTSSSSRRQRNFVLKGTSFWLLRAGVPILYPHGPALGPLSSVWLAQEALLFGGKQGKDVRTLLDTWPSPETSGSIALCFQRLSSLQWLHVSRTFCSV